MLIIAVKILNTMPFCKAPGAFLILAGHGRNTCIVHLADRVAEFVRDAPCTEDAKPKLLHAERFLSLSKFHDSAVVSIIIQNPALYKGNLAKGKECGYNGLGRRYPLLR